MRSVTVKGADFRSIYEVHEYLAEQLQFPSYYGKNLSALYDVLTETDLETRIELDFTDLEDPLLHRSLERMADVIVDATEENDRVELILVGD